jgi:DNA-binding NarL/FixJ family response regulator
MAVKVLILEDNPVARSFLCRVVRESFSDSIAITEAGDLETARRHVSLTGGAQGLHGVDPFKLVMVDLELPDGNGMELLAELSQYPATKIVTTLYSDDDHLFPALQCGADGYLLKEDRFEVLVEELQKIVRGQPPLSPAMAAVVGRSTRANLIRVSCRSRASRPASPSPSKPSPTTNA